MRVSLFCFLFCLILLGIVGCAAEKRMQPTKVTAFLMSEGAAPKGPLKNLPFDLAQVQPGFNPDNYSKVIIAPINTSYINWDDWRNSLSVAIASKEGYTTEVASLATFAKQALSDAFASKEGNRFQIVNSRSPGTLTIEISLSEVTFGKPLTSAGALVAPVPGASVIVGAAVDSSVAFEMRIRDASTNQILASVADRAFPTARIVNFNKLSASSACREIVETWAKLVVKSLNEGKLGKVSRPKFELVPW